MRKDGGNLLLSPTPQTTTTRTIYTHVLLVSVLLLLITCIPTTHAQQQQQQQRQQQQLQPEPEPSQQRSPHLALDSKTFHAEAQHVMEQITNFTREIEKNLTVVPVVPEPSNQFTGQFLRDMQNLTVSLQNEILSKQDLLLQLQTTYLANSKRIADLQRNEDDHVDTSLMSKALSYARSQMRSYNESAKVTANLTQVMDAFALVNGQDLVDSFKALTDLMLDRVHVESKALGGLKPIANDTFSPEVPNQIKALIAENDILDRNISSLQLDLVNIQSQIRTTSYQMRTARAQLTYDESFEAEERPFWNVRRAVFHKQDFILSHLKNVLGEADTQISSSLPLQIVHQVPTKKQSEERSKILAASFTTPTNASAPLTQQQQQKEAVDESVVMYRAVDPGECDHYAYLFSSTEHRITSLPTTVATATVTSTATATMLSPNPNFASADKVSFSVFLRAAPQPQPVVLFSVTDEFRDITLKNSSASKNNLENDFRYVVYVSENGDEIWVELNGKATLLAQLSRVAMFDGEWHVIVVTWSRIGGEVSCFVDGIFRARHWGVGVDLNSGMKPGATIVLGNLPPHSDRTTSNYMGFVGQMRDALVVFGIMGPQEVVDFSHRRVYSGKSRHVHWALDQSQGNSISDTGTSKLSATSYGGAWVGIKTHNGFPLTEFKSIAPVISCAQNLSSGDLEVLRRILQGPQGIPSPNSRGKLVVPDSQFVNPYKPPIGK